MVRCIHPYIPAMVNSVELWLSKKAKEGWRLVDAKYWIFTFQKCKSSEYYYFFYTGFDASKGLNYEFHWSKTRYGKNISPINKKYAGIFEVDAKKVDVDFYRIVALRNTYYFRHYLLLTLFALLFSIVLLILYLLANKFAIIVFTTSWMWVLLYAFVSLLIIGIHNRKQKDGNLQAIYQENKDAL